MTLDDKAEIVARVERQTNIIIEEVRSRARRTVDEACLIEPLDVLFERETRKAMNICEGNSRKAAKLLGVGRNTIFRNLKRWDEVRVKCAASPGEQQMDSPSAAPRA